MKVPTVRGSQGPARSRAYHTKINWKSNRWAVWLDCWSTILDELEGDQAMEIYQKNVKGPAIRTTNFEEATENEGEGEIMVRTVSDIPEEVKKHIDDPNLVSKMGRSETFLTSMVNAIHNVKDCLEPNDKISAYTEGDERDVIQKNKIKVELAIGDSEENLTEWKRREKEIKKAVREAEEEDIMIYTFVDRKRD